jgi:dephospho-CoA kinase
MGNHNLVVGIMGKIGSGKSTVSRILQNDYGFECLDADKFGHSALEKERDALIRSFGKQIVGPDGNIDRKILGNIVFSDTEELALLNSIVHPRIKKDICQIIGSSKDKKFVIDAALLFEIGLDESCDYIVSVEAPVESVIRRVSENRRWDEKKIRNVLAAQQYMDFLKDKTDFIIYNNKDDLKLRKQLEFFILAIS